MASSVSRTVSALSRRSLGSRRTTDAANAQKRLRGPPQRAPRTSTRGFAQGSGIRKGPEAAASRASARFPGLSRTDGAQGFPNVNAKYRPDEHPPLAKLGEVQEPEGASLAHWKGDWSASDLHSAVEDHVMMSWGPSGPAKDLPTIVDAKGIYLYDSEGK
ncbi:unnamed protein product, partial [Prorocentrum cordatum]